MKNLLIRFFCTIGVHWSGPKGTGMYGDANECEHCGATGYGLIVLKDSPDQS